MEEMENAIFFIFQARILRNEICFQGLFGTYLSKIEPS